MKGGQRSGTALVDQENRGSVREARGWENMNVRYFEANT
jgi:hypothetical protein